MPKLRAQEDLASIPVRQLASGLLKQSDQRKILNELQRAAEFDRPRSQKPKDAEHMRRILAQTGVGFYG